MNEFKQAEENVMIGSNVLLFGGRLATFKGEKGSHVFNSWCSTVAKQVSCEAVSLCGLHFAYAMR